MRFLSTILCSIFILFAQICFAEVDLASIVSLSGCRYAYTYDVVMHKSNKVSVRCIDGIFESKNLTFDRAAKLQIEIESSLKNLGFKIDFDRKNCFETVGATSTTTLCNIKKL